MTGTSTPIGGSTGNIKIYNNFMHKLQLFSHTMYKQFLNKLLFFLSFPYSSVRMHFINNFFSFKKNATTRINQVNNFLRIYHKAVSQCFNQSYNQKRKCLTVSYNDLLYFFLMIYSCYFLFFIGHFPIN